MQPVVIIDYGMGNIYSVKSALRYLGVESILSVAPNVILSAKYLILPGVGSFRVAMENLYKLGLDVVIHEAVSQKKIPLLGICLGMQLLGVSSAENGLTHGLGLIDYPVERFAVNEDQCKIPHVGFNTVRIQAGSILYKELGESADFYFTHSFRMSDFGMQHVSGTCSHGENFIASIEKDNIFGTQFHPEKSQSNGLFVLKNFLEWKQNG